MACPLAFKESLYLFGLASKTYIATALGMCACHQGKRVTLYTTAELVISLVEARGEKALGKFKKQLARQELVINQLGVF